MSFGGQFLVAHDKNRYHDTVLKPIAKFFSFCPLVKFFAKVFVITKRPVGTRALRS